MTYEEMKIEIESAYELMRMNELEKRNKMSVPQIMDGLQYVARLAQCDIAVSYESETDSFTIQRFLWYGAYGLRLVETQSIGCEELVRMFDTDMQYLKRYEREVN